MNASDLKVLFVDDMASIRGRVKSHFTKLGVTDYHEAADGQEALRLTEAAHLNGRDFDLILSDLNMKGMNGFDFLKAIRRHPNLKIQHTRFIMVTAQPENVLVAVDLGANQCLHKPFGVEELGLRIVWVFGDQWQGEHFVLDKAALTESQS